MADELDSMIKNYADENGVTEETEEKKLDPLSVEQIHEMESATFDALISESMGMVAKRPAAFASSEVAFGLSTPGEN